MPFLQPFTYKEINRNIIYIATDYSMYNARSGSQLQLTRALFWRKTETADMNSPVKAWCDLAKKHRL